MTIDFGVQARSFSFDLGSIDTYNTIQLIFLTPAQGQSAWTGADMTNVSFGDWFAAASNRRVTFTAINGERITGVKLISSQNSLEVDNFAVNAVPEPETWAMMMLGFGLVGATARRLGIRTVAA